MPSAREVNVVFKDNGAGLTQDATVVGATLLAAGHRVTFTPRTPRRLPLALNYLPELSLHAWRAVSQRLVRGVRRWDVNIFLESVVPEYLDRASQNWLFANQEWLTEQDRLFLTDVDLVLCKTHHAEHLLPPGRRGLVYTGFTSLDRRLPRTTNPAAALHVCGWNLHKGTRAVLDVWARHPEWPTLTLVSQLDLTVPQASNIRCIRKRIDGTSLVRLQNSCLVHVCPSEVEGFGHTLVEALSCGSVVVTTDAPPMNEIVDSTEGFLAAYERTEDIAAGRRYFVDARDLERQLDCVWRMTDVERTALARAAREKFERLRADFERRFVSLLHDC